MRVPIRLIIADDEPFICGMLEKLIDFETLGLELVDSVNDGQTLEARIEELRPDIVLTDISMPRQDGLDVIRKIREKGIECRFLIISGYRKFEYAYDALKYNVDDYVLKPVEKTELNRILKKICDEICGVVPGDDDVKKLRQRGYLIENGIHKELRDDSLSMDEINRLFKCSFKQGCFRMVMMKLDFTWNEKQHKEDVSSVVNKLRNMGTQTFRSCCAEVIYSEQRDRIVFLLNYEKADGTIRQMLKDLHFQAKHVAELFRGFNLTLCVGKAVSRICYVEESLNSCERACWLRMQYGINRVIFEEEFEDVKVGSFQSNLDSIRDGLERAYIAMDGQTMQSMLRQFFQLPVPILCGSEAIAFVYSSLAFLCERYAFVTRENGNEADIQSNIIAELDMQTSLRNYEMTLIKQIDKLLKEMESTTRDKNAKPVLRATAYIESHYSEHISLETMAGIVNLNPIYFSNLFKRELGKSFTEYLTEYRMKKAREMLRGTDKNISEIAYALGYSDARYFSKVFKKEVGVRPTEYRKIYG